jgi:hypothetical protein
LAIAILTSDRGKLKNENASDQAIRAVQRVGDTASIPYEGGELEATAEPFTVERFSTVRLVHGHHVREPGYIGAIF